MNNSTGMEMFFSRICGADGFWNNGSNCLLTHLRTNLVHTFLKDFLMTSLFISFHASLIQLTITHYDNGFKFLVGVFWLIPSSASHLSYFFVANALNGLSQRKSAAWMYFVHPLGTILLLIFFARSEDLTLSFMCHS